jgi:hypothetical protein
MAYFIRNCCTPGKGYTGTRCQENKLQKELGELRQMVLGPKKENQSNYSHAFKTYFKELESVLQNKTSDVNTFEMSNHLVPGIICSASSVRTQNVFENK